MILLLQNMFPKGKFNTDISRNALYKVLFRSPGDRKQIDIMAEQTFAKDRTNFMKAYTRETEKPFGYIILDNHPRTSNEHQVVANAFGDCYTYPRITKTDSPSLQSNVSLEVQPKLAMKRKVELPFPTTKKLKKSTVKRKVKSENKSTKKLPTVKRRGSHQRPVAKKSKKRKPTKKKQPKERFTGSLQKEFSSEESEEDTSEEYHENISDEPDELQRQSCRVVRSRGGFGPG